MSEETNNTTTPATKFSTPDFLHKAAPMDTILGELYQKLDEDDINEFKEKAKDTLNKIKEAKKLVRVYEASLSKDYQMFKDGIL